MKTRLMRWSIGAVALAAIIMLQAAPAAAQPPQFPERYSIVWFDIAGFLIECTDFRPCTLPECPADMFFAGKRVHLRARVPDVGNQALSGP